MLITLFMLALPFRMGIDRGGSSSDRIVLSAEFVADAMPTPQCHASTIAEARGALVAAWFGGEREGTPDVGIWLSRRSASGWTAPVRVAVGDSGERKFPCWNPVLFEPKDGPLLLFYKVGPNPKDWWGMLKKSADGGVTWSSPVRLPDGVIGPVKNKPVELADGTLLCPSSTEKGGWRVWMERTSDLGTTWKRFGPLNEPSVIEAIQPSILQKTGKELQAVGRTKQGYMFSIESSDGGSTWTKMRLLSFRCANSGIDGLMLKDGRMLVVYNGGTNSPERWGAGRDTLNVAISTDGQEWKTVCLLEHEPGQEFSYPAVIQTHDGRVHITYTWKRLKIRHVTLDPRRIKAR